MRFDELTPAGRVVALIVTLAGGAYLTLGMPWLTEAINSGQAAAMGGRYYPGLTVVVVWLPAIFLGYVAGRAVDVVGWRPPSTVPGRVRMIAAPPGDEPEAVRAAWVGMVLPLAPGETGSRPHPAAGPVPVGGHPGSPPGEPGKVEWAYVVDAPAALALLAARDPDAAVWWRQHAPECSRPGHRFMFGTDVCELELPEPAG